tara:strand:+ start:274 stop:1029 length:756 start_codon:yes stop_codon:yes gene_type:complete
MGSLGKVSTTAKALVASFRESTTIGHVAIQNWIVELGNVYCVVTARSRKDLKVSVVELCSDMTNAMFAKYAGAASALRRMADAGILTPKQWETISTCPELVVNIVGTPDCLYKVNAGLDPKHVHFTETVAAVKALKPSGWQPTKARALPWLTTDEAKAIQKAAAAAAGDQRGNTGKKEERKGKTTASGSALVKGTEGSFGAVIKAFGEGNDTMKQEIMKAWQASSLPANVHAFASLVEEYASEIEAGKVTA